METRLLAATEEAFFPPLRFSHLMSITEKMIPAEEEDVVITFVSRASRHQLLLLACGDFMNGNGKQRGNIREKRTAGP